MKNLTEVIDIACFQRKTFKYVQRSIITHKHPSVELLYVTDGTVEIEFVDASGQDQILFVYPHEFIIIAPNIEHALRTAVDNTCILELEAMHAKNNMSLFDYLASVPLLHNCKHFNNILSSTTTVSKLTDNVGLEQLLRQIIELLDSHFKNGRDDMFEIDFTVMFYRLLSEICHCKILPEQSMNNLHINHIITFVRNNYEKDLSVKRIADALHLSVSYLQTLFKREMNTNIIAYINSVRLEHATTLMQNKALDLKEIATLCGFKTYRNFYNNFVKQNKITPTEWLEHDPKEIFTVLAP